MMVHDNFCQAPLSTHIVVQTLLSFMRGTKRVGTFP